MADTFKGIITADGKKRQLPYGAVLDRPVSDATLSKEGGFADSKAVGDKFAKVDSETASLKEDTENNSKTAENSFLSDTIHLFISHSQGRWIETESGQIEKETGASENVTSIRVRSDVIISYPYPVTVQAIDGFLFSLYYVDADGKKISEISWNTAWTIPQAVNFALTIKKSDNGALDNSNHNVQPKLLRFHVWNRKLYI